MHKPICKEFPVVNGINALHTTGSWKEHLAILRKRAARFPDHDSNVKRVFSDPKVCYTCRESRPNLLTMCKCGYVCHCSKNCAQADKWHQLMCSDLILLNNEASFLRMRLSYPMTLLTVVEQLYDEETMAELDNLKVHVVTNSAYFDASAWQTLFHQPNYPNLKQLKLDFIIQNTTFNSSFNHKGKLDQQKCDICPGLTPKEHTLNFSVHQKPYHMFFSSSDYSAPDFVIVYGITETSSDIHSELSYRNMLFDEDTSLVLTDSTEELLIQGTRAVNSAIPVDVLLRPLRNNFRCFGSNKSEMDFDAAATNERYYVTCMMKLRQI